MFQEEPVDVVWKFTPKAAPDAREFLFHPTQTMEIRARRFIDCAIPRRRIAGNGLASVYVGRRGRSTSPAAIEGHVQTTTATSEWLEPISSSPEEDDYKALFFVQHHSAVKLVGNVRQHLT